MNKLILLLALGLIGCANTQIIEQAKRETQERKQLEYYDNKNIIPTAGRGPLEMPQEWMDQWPK
jgi:hypothetical protein